ncbi:MULTISPECIES: carph-isopro domain-containing protein [Agrobacterium tumefaciens complex]|uniref:Uncharacterized protein n=1 Tax=Agrobacterium tomkonis CFBP 6623 TaxID=1183432 RepID=A0A1S7NMQ0_9HYPH|nr:MULTISPECIES: hypothetical protein [Agrobacterium tumefaciens complex]QCL89627.1 hypothetical protein CFBP6623_11035 [Agrobacterium tumefaciens]CUX09233.1 conserved hypothetical protein [Agrobacterium tomkonis CFBP 6623]
MDTTPTLTIAEIISRAGGPKAIADASRLTADPFSKDAVYKWAKGGIPDRHWPIIIALTHLEVSAIYSANLAARGNVFPQLFHEAVE